MESGKQELTFPRPFGKYTLIDRVAEGGMAEIYLALEQTTHAGRRFVTIKRIRADQADDPDFVDFFLTEGRVSMKCSHPNLPHVYELGEIDGSHYLAMEYIHGHTLLDLLRSAIRARRTISPQTAVTVALGVAAALEHAHGLCDVDGAPLGVIHRDVTPQNVMLSMSGGIKLIDFGIVRAAIQLHRTQTGIVKGKFAYMAPEQLEGKPSLDHRADLFALGIVLWESLAARPLFRGKSDLETIDFIRHMDVPDLAELRSDVPRTLTAVVAKALARDPDRRFQTATEFLSALEYVAEHCHLIPAVTKLRAELVDLCGYPKAPTIPPSVMDPDDTSRRLALGSDPDASPPEDSMLITEGSDPEIQAATGLERDPLLVYFLRQSGARLGPEEASGEQTKDPAPRSNAGDGSKA